MWNELIFAWQSSGLSLLLNTVVLWVNVVGALALLLWMILLKRKPSGLRTAAGMLGLGLLPGALLAGISASPLRSLHPVWMTLLLAVPIGSLLLALGTIGWTALFRAAFGQEECGRCRQRLLSNQSTCSECGWSRGAPRGVRQARVFSLAALGGISAAVSLAALNMAMGVPLSWTAQFEVWLHEAPPALVGASAINGLVTPTLAPGGSTYRMAGRSSQVMSVFKSSWEPIGFSHLEFSCESTPNAWTTYLVLPEDDRQYTPPFLEVLTNRLEQAMTSAYPTLSPDRIKRTAALQAAFVRAMKERADSVPQPAKWVQIMITELEPPLVLVVVPMVSGPLAAVALARFVRRRRHGGDNPKICANS